MALDERLVWLIVLVIAIEGVWLIGLTYLLWKRHVAKKKGAAPEPDPVTKST